MNTVLQLGFYLALSYLGEQVARNLPFPFPGSVVAMIFLFILLVFKLIKLEQLEQSSGFLLANMGLFIVPAAVGLLESVGLVSDQLWAFLAVVFLTTVITMLITMLVTHLLIKLQKGKQSA